MKLRKNMQFFQTNGYDSILISQEMNTTKQILENPILIEERQ